MTKAFVKKGDTIIATDENAELVVKGFFPNGSAVDFLADYTKPSGTTPNGEVLYGSRGFSFMDDHWKLKE